HRRAARGDARRPAVAGVAASRAGGGLRGDRRGRARGEDAAVEGRVAARTAALAALAGALTLALVLVTAARHRDEIRWFGRFQLPAFDAYAYVATAEQPRYFTVAPWGYRVLTPWTVHALGRVLPLRSVVQAYVVEMVAGFTLAGTLLFLFLRVLGH